MRFIILTLVVTCIVVATLASPAKDLKEAKKEASNKKACLQTCPNDYSPVCAGKPGSKQISFGSICVMNNYNCEKGETLEKISDGECPGGKGVRLS